MGNAVQIRFVSFQYNRWKRATEKEQTTAFLEEDRLPYRMATDYSDLLRVNITSGKFDAGYKPYNLRYFDWKYFVFGSNYGFWRLRGELFRAISVFKQRSGRIKGWMGGIPSGETDSGNVSWLGKGDRGRPVPIAQYARWMEFGRRGQPERPLFQPTLVEYRTGGAVKQLAATSIKFRGAWR
jgi:hypothetical protein